MQKAAKIIHYNQNDGKGMINANGQTHAFEISHWRGTEAPKVNTSVECEFGADGVMALHPISDAQLAQEKAAEIKAQMSALGGQLGEKLASHGGSLGAGLIATHGIPTLVAYALFALSSFAFTFATFKGVHLDVTLFSLGDMSAKVGKSNNLTLLVFWLALGAIAAPIFIRHKLIPLLLCLPLLATLLGLFDVYTIYQVAVNLAQQQSDAMNSALRSMGSLFGRGNTVASETLDLPFSKLISIGLGFYAMLASSAYLAWQGVIKFLAAR
jgi:hypothetical protein